VGYRWDIGGITKGQLRNDIKQVMDRWRRGNKDQFEEFDGFEV